MKKLRGVLVAGVLVGACGILFVGCSSADHEDSAVQVVTFAVDMDEGAETVTAGVGFTLNGTSAMTFVH